MPELAGGQRLALGGDDLGALPALRLVVLGGGYTAAEQTLFEASKWHEVRQARTAWQDSMALRFVERIQRLTRRRVKAFLSANRQDA